MLPVHTIKEKRMPPVKKNKATHISGCTVHNMQKELRRKEIAAFIKKHSSFYTYTNLSIHSKKQLKEIYEGLLKEMNEEILH